MSTAVTKIKSRIKSVSGAYKVTSAMKLVSTSRLKKYRNKMLSYRDFSLEIEGAVATVLKTVEKVHSPFIEINERSSKDLYIIVSSTLGLCGSYNNNLFKLADVSLKKNDDAIILGGKGILHFKDGEYKIIPGFESYKSSEDNGFIKQLTNYVSDEYVKQTYRNIHIIYSHYKNPVTFLPQDFILLPLKNKEDKIQGYGPLLEPTPASLIEHLLPIYLETVIRSKLLESEVCEQAARSNAMENATNNAKDLLDELKIEFNKARQGAITQEIIEIVGASQTL